MTPLINKRLQAYRAQVDEIVKDLHELAIRTASEDLAETVSDLRNRIHEPFMFVIVGEVKAGKSSFINALLATGKEVTKVAPQPMTDTIQQILYGEEESYVPINPYLKKIHLPVDILKEIAIVDTPGTNTIVEHHQEITERFIPASDLIVFVFEAKNPYRQSAWQLFDYIHTDWRKKIIFVLQQKDLMPDEDLQVNLNGVREYAEKQGISAPEVFAVSAKQEQEGQTQESGFGPVRAYISTHITGGKAPVLKLHNNLSTVANLNSKIAAGIALRQKQFEADTAFREDIRSTLLQQETKSLKQVDVLVENLLAGYGRITRQREQELSEGLGFFPLLKRSIASIFNRNASMKEWLERLASGLEDDLNKELKAKLNDGVADLADSIQQMAKMIDLKIRSSQTILRDDHELFSDIAEKRTNVLRELQEQFSRFVSRTENFTDDSLFPDKSSVSGGLAASSGLAVIGLVLATVTQGAVFDITGGLLTAVGLIFAGATTASKRRQVMREFKAEIQNGGDKLEEEVTSNLKAYISNLRSRIDENFIKFDLLLEKEEAQLQKLHALNEDITGRVAALIGELSTAAPAASTEEE